MHKVVLFAASSEFSALIQRAEKLFVSGQVRLVKDEPKTKAGFIYEGQGRVYFLKRFVPSSWSSALADRLLRGSRAKRSLAGAYLLRANGFSVPAPLAVMEVRKAGLVLCSYLLSEAIDGSYTLSQFIDRTSGPGGISYARRAQVLHRVAQEVRKLHDKGLFTWDLQETNILLRERAGSLEIYFVDLDGFWRASPRSWRARRRNLVQLDRSVGRFMSRAERLRFLRSYLGDQAKRAQLKGIARKLIAERARKERKAARQEKRSREIFFAEALGNNAFRIGAD